MDENDGLKQFLIRWWRKNWDRVVAKLTIPVALVATFMGFGLAADYPPQACGCSWAPTPAHTSDQQVESSATDVFVGRVLGFTIGPNPASPVQGTSTARPPLHLMVEVLYTSEGTATGTIVVHYGFRIRGEHHDIDGVTKVGVGDVLAFFTVRDDPTGTYILVAGPYFYYTDPPLRLPDETASGVK